MEVEQYIAFYESPLGMVELRCDDTHINSVQCHDIQEDTFKNSEQLPAIMNIAIAQIEEYFAGTRSDFDLPLRQKGTDFQQSVWKGLLDIPYGKTISYLTLSRQLGDEKAIRAVGTANGRNRLWIIVPCHRVIGSDGSLTGYAGGLWRKKWLLDHERRMSGQQVVEQLGLF